MSANYPKRPVKGILKNSSSFDKESSHSQPSKKSKETKWDEMNIIATLHPVGKDYGHMKIDEPKTPYNYSNDDQVDGLNPGELAEKIKLGAEKPAKIFQQESDSDSDEEELTEEDKQKKREFETKRKQHYNEFHALQAAKKLLEEEEEDDDDDDDVPVNTPVSVPAAPVHSAFHQKQNSTKAAPTRHSLLFAVDPNEDSDTKLETEKMRRQDFQSHRKQFVRSSVDYRSRKMTDPDYDTGSTSSDKSGIVSPSTNSNVRLVTSSTRPSLLFAVTPDHIDDDEDVISDNEKQKRKEFLLKRKQFTRSSCDFRSSHMRMNNSSDSENECGQLNSSKNQNGNSN